MITNTEFRLRGGRATARTLVPLLFLVSALTLASPHPEGRDTLDMGFRFASAIVSDTKDMARAQQTLVYDYARIGDYDQAYRQAARIKGWRRGVAFARLAEALAQAGQVVNARKALDLARKARGEAEGWYGPRVDSYIADANVAIGDINAAERIMAALAKADRQYQGRSVSMSAMILARSGTYQEALTQLASLDASKDIYDSWWQTRGYLAMLDLDALDRDQRKELLSKASAAADRIAGWKKIEAFLSIEKEYRDLGEIEKSEALLSSVETLVGAIAPTTGVKAHMSARLARAFAEAGHVERAREVILGARTGLVHLPVIERPELSAVLSMAAREAGERALARELLGEALVGASALDNARPRALAAVAICGAVGREGRDLEEANRDRLVAIFEGLGDPW